MNDLSLHPNGPRSDRTVWTPREQSSLRSRSGSADFTEGQVGSMVDLYAGNLMPDFQAHTLQNTEHAFATRTIRRGGTVRPLAYGAQFLKDFPINAGNTEYDLYDYVSRNRVSGLLVMQDDKVVLEHYDLGMNETSRWLSMSMAKSFATTLIGAAIQDGLIGGVEDMLTRYLPQLIGTAYDGVTIQQLMQMTSGVAWDDTHTDPNSERRHMLDLQVAQKPDAIMRYMTTLKRVAAPGTVWNYSTGETHVVGALVKAATGKWLSDYLSENIWSRLGMEADACWWLEAKDGLEVAGSGICATLRDYTRFARFILDNGVIDGERILPENWLREAASPRLIGGKQVDYGYMWWPVADAKGSFEDGAYSARGIFGQYIYVNPRRKILITVLSSRAKPKGAEAILDNDFFNATVRALGG
ncbi:serine hydrolase [Asticcacaulis sp.]|uniref:serine hydrolase domain-containing protein n=1 Tax=Asticcacaulis sp. TaxID=1872648 RepID=UPI002C980DAB|nr:serine hydrolase [Asticcacaulis sp.]HTM81401.1 serine hydrolase [Asticcacaulis sp.]